MDIKEIESAVLVIKWVYPIISGGFILIVSLLVYIWKGNVSSTNKILDRLVVIVDKLEKSEVKNSLKIQNLENSVEKLAS